ncbi:MAG: hypothetical protein NVSMB29_01150 [Candidatus Dormibacteria bacterium]
MNWRLPFRILDAAPDLTYHGAQRLLERQGTFRGGREMSVRAEGGSPRGLNQATVTGPTQAEVTDAEGSVAEVHDSPDFVELRRRFRAFAFPMTGVFLAWYLLYVIASGWARPFMATQVVGNVNVAFIFGLLQFASTFLIAFLYARYAGARLDPLAAKLRKRMTGDRG